MSFIKFLGEKYLYIIFNFICMFLTCFILAAIKAGVYAIFFICSLFFIVNFVNLIYTYLKQKRYLDEINKTLDSLDEKYLLSELIKKGDTVFEKNIYQIIRSCNKSMADKVQESIRINKEYREFIELWVHEVKTPIASSKFIIENNKNDVTKSLKEEMNKIDDYVEKALFYARSGSVEKDYIIKRINLETLVNTCIKRDASYLIQKSCRIFKDNLSFDIFTDSKWTEFIIHQVITNSIKYFDKDVNTLSFKGKCEKERIILTIEDNGIGMDKAAVERVFEKGFTGENGRLNRKSTGIGLYLSKVLCKRLGMDMYIESEEGKGTKANIVFPNESMISDIKDK